MTKKFYVMTEVEADITGDLTNDELARRVRLAVQNGKKKNDQKFYAQQIADLYVCDEKGNML